MENNERVLNIIEDHIVICNYLDAICCALENGTDMPNFSPITNDMMVGEQLEKICETFTKLRRKLL